MHRTVPFVLASLTSCGGDAGPAIEPSAGIVTTPVEFSVETWPGEGIPVIEARRGSQFLHVAPDPASPIIDTVVTNVGARVHFDSTRYQTIQSGSIAVLRATSVSGRDFGARNHLTYDEYYSADTENASVRVAPPLTIEFLQHRAEGTCFVRLNGRVINADPCPIFDSASVRVEREPVVRWWVRTPGQHGRYGWLQLSDTTVRSTGRQFE
jgi:hypothetical protein